MATRIQKYENDQITPLPGRIFGTIVLIVTEATEAYYHENTAQVVDEYIARKLRESGNRTIKVGRTLTSFNKETQTLEGRFHWSLKGTFYEQLAIWDVSRNSWILERPID